MKAALTLPWSWPRTILACFVLRLGIVVRGAIVAAVVIAGFLAGGFEWLELKTLNGQFHLRGPRSPQSPIVIVSIDEDSFDEFNMTWPWPRALHGALVRILRGGGAVTVGLDIFFSEPSLRGPDDDEDLGRAVGEAGNVVLAAGLTVARQEFLERVDLNLPVETVREGAAGIGVVNLAYDDDAFVRRATLSVTHQQTAIPSFALALHRLAVDAGVPSAPLPPTRTMLINYVGPPGAFPTVSYYRIITGEVPPEAFRGKIVLVGATSPALHDIFATPFAPQGRMPGVEVHANILDTLLSGVPLTRIPAAMTAAFILAAAVVTVWVTRRMRPLVALAVVAGVGAGFAAAAFAGFSWARLWTDQVPVLVTLSLAYVIVTTEDIVHARREKQRLARFFSPNVLRQIVEQRTEPGRSRRLVTVLFSDIRGFTPIAERLSPEEVADFLRDHMTTLTEAIFARGGTVVQFVGDEIMALFNAPFDQPDHEIEAVRAALELQKRAVEISARWMDRCGSPIKIGVGVHTGDAIVGLVGSRQRVEYGAIGDTINLGSRLQGLTKEFAVPIIISESTYRTAGAHFACRLLGDVGVRGRAVPVKIYAVEGGGHLRAPRAAVGGVLTLTVGEGESRVSTRCSLGDLSASGLRATEVPRRFTAGEVVRVEFAPPGAQRSIAVAGQVAWSANGAAGIRFLDLSPADAQMIVAILAVRPAENIPPRV